MRPLNATLAAAGLALVVPLGLLLCGCADPGGLRVTGPAESPVAGTLPVEVVAGPGQPPVRRPASFVIGGSVRLAGLRWLSWGGPRAEATGEVSGDWCAPACGEKPYPARVVFAGLVRQDRFAYYGRAEVRAEGVPPEQHRELRNLRLYVPRH
ncbi:hypothetical protein GCM10010218_52540 [Streptomyces mashuensis]|uniref:Lipoprotein n=1 Tax=Streptomyces mashuensis TaxID=33904 RepID=A0A919EEH4_9ACTN|nr:hypothetical protein [Streptomyces mashuensis]GHF64473.1 hypothetical protein GCM10010218_52540 [Streptomyces mashuensis]